MPIEFSLAEVALKKVANALVRELSSMMFYHQMARFSVAKFAPLRDFGVD